MFWRRVTDFRDGGVNGKQPSGTIVTNAVVSQRGPTPLSIDRGSPKATATPMFTHSPKANGPSPGGAARLYVATSLPGTPTAAALTQSSPPTPMVTPVTPLINGVAVISSSMSSSTVTLVSPIINGRSLGLITSSGPTSPMHSVPQLDDAGISSLLGAMFDARAIWNQFISAGAAYEVNLGSTMRSAVRDSLDSYLARATGLTGPPATTPNSPELINLRDPDTTLTVTSSLAYFDAVHLERELRTVFNGPLEGISSLTTTPPIHRCFLHNMYAHVSVYWLMIIVVVNLLHVNSFSRFRASDLFAAVLEGKSGWTKDGRHVRLDDSSSGSMMLTVAGRDRSPRATSDKGRHSAVISPGPSPQALFVHSLDIRGGGNNNSGNYSASSVPPTLPATASRRVSNGPTTLATTKSN
jgi:hypothetical protein